MNDTLKRILNKHAAPPSDLLSQRTPASQPCPKCNTRHGGSWCPFRSDEEIISNLAQMIVEEFPTRDAKALVRLLCTEGPRVALELHDALNAPTEE